MSKSNKQSPTPNATPLKKGYQPNKSVMGGHQPTTSQRSPSKPPSNPPNKGSAGKK